MGTTDESHWLDVLISNTHYDYHDIQICEEKNDDDDDDACEEDPTYSIRFYSKHRTKPNKHVAIVVYYHIDPNLLNIP